MLDDREIEEYIANLRLSSWASDYVRRAREESPSRQVGGGECSMMVTWPSEKIPFTQDLESRTHELVYARMGDADPEVIEMWAQPPPIRVYTRDKDNRRHGHWYTPDFLTLKIARSLLVEIKKTRELEQLALDKPEQWQLTDKTWHYIPAEIAASEIGHEHITLCTEDLNPILARNFIFLRDYRWAPEFTVSTQTLTRLQKAIDVPTGITIARLLPPHSTWDADTIYFAIARSHIYAPIFDQDLSDTVRCRLFSDQTAYELFKVYAGESRRENAR